MQSSQQEEHNKTNEAPRVKIPKTKQTIDWDEFFDKLSEENKQNTPIIVEGKNDRKALKEFGCKNILTLSKTPLYEVVESILQKNHKRVIILTDLDKEGKLLYSKLSHELKQRGVHIDNTLREFLFKTQLRQIEGLVRYVGRTDRK